MSVMPSSSTSEEPGSSTTIALTLPRRHYKKDSRFVNDLYTLTYDDNESLDTVKLKSVFNQPVHSLTVRYIWKYIRRLYTNNINKPKNYYIRIVSKPWAYLDRVNYCLCNIVYRMYVKGSWLIIWLQYIKLHLVWLYFVFIHLPRFWYFCGTLTILCASSTTTIILQCLMHVLIPLNYTSILHSCPNNRQNHVSLRMI